MTRVGPVAAVVVDDLGRHVFALGASRPVRPDEIEAVRETWWRLRRQGVPLPAEAGVIAIAGGRA